MTEPTLHEPSNDFADETEDAQTGTKFVSGTRQLRPHPWVGGTSFGEFVIDSFIGFGGWATVYRAHHPQLGAVALKLLSGEHRTNVECRDRFEREQELLTRIEHKRVVRAIDSGTHEDTPYLAMELLCGEDLEATRLRHKMLEPRVAVTLVAQLLDAVQAVHNKGIVHRDLKPANVFIDVTDGYPRLVLVDFGIAQGGGARLTATGQLNGTPNYMSPEQLRGEANDVRVDVWAAGVVAYELLCGRTPTDGLPLGELMVSILQDDVPRLENVPSELADVIERALERNPDERYQSAEEFHQALCDWAMTSDIELSVTLHDLGVVPKTTVPLALGAFGGTPAGATPAMGVPPSTSRPSRTRLKWMRGLALAIAPFGGVVLGAVLVPPAAPSSSDTLAPAPAAEANDGPLFAGAVPVNPREARNDEHTDESGLAPQSVQARLGSSAATSANGNGEGVAGAAPVNRREARNDEHSELAPHSVQPRTSSAATSANGNGENVAESGTRPSVAPSTTSSENDSANPARSIDHLLHQARNDHLRGRSEQALRSYREATRTHPRSSAAWRGHGLLALQMGYKTQGNASLRRYLRLAPGADDAPAIRRRLDAR